MNISTREKGGVTVVGVEGNLDMSTAPEAQQHLDALQDDGVQKILVDFEAPGCMLVKGGLSKFADWITSQNMWFIGGPQHRSEQSAFR